MIENIEDMLIEVSEFCTCKDGATGRTVTYDFENQICDTCGKISK